MLCYDKLSSYSECAFSDTVVDTGVQFINIVLKRPALRNLILTILASVRISTFQINILAAKLSNAVKHYKTKTYLSCEFITDLDIVYITLFFETHSWFYFVVVPKGQNNKILQEHKTIVMIFGNDKRRIRMDIENNSWDVQQVLAIPSMNCS